MNKTTEALKLSLPALENAESVAASINAGKRHAIQVDEETCFWQREEWVRWAIDEVLPEIRQALAAIREALADHVEQSLTMVAEPVKQEPVAYLCGGYIDNFPTGRYETCEATDYGAFPVYAAPVQPVKQEPVIWHSVWDFVDVRRDPPEQDDEKDWLPLYAAPVDAKAIRAEERQRCIEAIRKAHDEELCDAWDCIKVIKELE